jgi:hypothetical protein
MALSDDRPPDLEGLLYIHDPSESLHAMLCWHLPEGYLLCRPDDAGATPAATGEAVARPDPVVARSDAPASAARSPAASRAARS